MSARIITLFKGLTTSDLEAVRPTDLERFAALCRHWASLADQSRDGRRAPQWRSFASGGAR